MNKAQRIYQQAELAKYAIDNLVAYLQANCENEMWKDVAITELKNIKTRQSVVMTVSKEILDTRYENHDVPVLSTKAGG